MLVPDFIKDNWLPAVIAAVLGTLGGTGVTQLSQTNVDYFTNPEAQRMEMRVNERIARIERDILKHCDLELQKAKLEMHGDVIEYVRVNGTAPHVTLRLDNLEKIQEQIGSLLDNIPKVQSEMLLRQIRIEEDIKSHLKDKDEP